MNMHCERAERASLENFAFSHSKTAISLNILLVHCLRNIYFRSQITSAYNYIIQLDLIRHGDKLGDPNFRSSQGQFERKKVRKN